MINIFSLRSESSTEVSRTVRPFTFARDLGNEWAGRGRQKSESDLETLSAPTMSLAFGLWRQVLSFEQHPSRQQCNSILSEGIGSICTTQDCFHQLKRIAANATRQYVRGRRRRGKGKIKNTNVAFVMSRRAALTSTNNAEFGKVRLQSLLNSPHGQIRDPTTSTQWRWNF